MAAGCAAAVDNDVVIVEVSATSVVGNANSIFGVGWVVAKCVARKLTGSVVKLDSAAGVVDLRFDWFLQIAKQRTEWYAMHIIRTTVRFSKHLQVQLTIISWNEPGISLCSSALGSFELIILMHHSCKRKDGYPAVDCSGRANTECLWAAFNDWSYIAIVN